MTLQAEHKVSQNSDVTNLAALETKLPAVKVPRFTDKVRLKRLPKRNSQASRQRPKLIKMYSGITEVPTGEYIVLANKKQPATKKKFKCFREQTLKLGDYRDKLVQLHQDEDCSSDEQSIARGKELLLKSLLATLQSL